MKKNMLLIILIIVISVTTTAIASNYLASQITYNDTTVDQALNELYTVHESYKNLTSDTTVTPESLLNGITAYNKNGELVTGNINTDCVSGTYLKPTNTYINIPLRFNPTRFYVDFVIPSNGNNHRIVYNTSFGTTSYDYIIKNNGEYQSTQENIVTISNNKLVDVTGTTTARYSESFNIYYTACK